MTQLFRGIRQLVTMAGPAIRRGRAMQEIGLIADGALLVRDGRILAAGPLGLLQESVNGEVEEIDCGGRLVTPGLVDAHTHLIFGGHRLNDFEARTAGSTYAQIAAAGGGIRSTMRATRSLSLEEMVAVGRQHLEWCLRCGTTTLEAKSGYGLDPETEQNLVEAVHRLNQSSSFAGKIHSTFLGAHAVPPEFEGRKSDYLDLIIDEILPQVAGRVESVDMFVEDGYFTPDDARRYAASAQTHGLKVRLHVDQMKNGGGAALAVELGCVSADHLEHTSPQGISFLAGSSVWPVLLPASVFGLGLTHYPNSRAMIEAGLPVVLATDFNPGSSPTPSLPLVMSLAVHMMKMSPAEALTACTAHAAGCLGMFDEVGSLEPGKRADFVIWDAEDYREIPYWLGRPMTHAVYQDGSLTYAAD